MMSPLYELRLWPIGTIDSHGTPACLGIVSPMSSFRHRRQRVDDETRQHAGQETERGQHEHRRERECVDFGRASRRPANAGGRER